MEQASLFIEEASVQVVKTRLTCRRCGGKTKKLTIAKEFLHRLIDKFMCGRCKRMDEEGESKLTTGLYREALIKERKPLVEHPPIKQVAIKKAVICKTKEEVHVVNRNGLVGVLHPTYCL